MITKRAWLFLLLLSGTVTLPVSGQPNTEKLSIDEAVGIALKNNKDMQAAMLDEKIADARFRQTAAVYLPQASASYTALMTNNPLNAFGFKLQQKIITQNDFNPDLLNHPSQTNDFSAKVDVRQPLLNVDLFYQRKAARTETELYAFRKKRATEYLSFTVRNAYYQLQMAYRTREVMKEALETAKAVFTFTHNRYQHGLLQKSDLLNAQVKVTGFESELATAENNIRNASDFISYLLGRTSGIIYQTNDLQEPETTPLTVENVPASRADFQVLQKAMEASGNIISSSKWSYLPRLNAFGSYQLNDNHLAGSYAGSYFAGIQLSMNIFNGTKTKNQIREQKLEQDKLAVQLQSLMSQGQTELNKAQRDLQDSHYRIKQQKAAVEHAAEAFRILKNRYEQGLVNTTDVLTAQTQLSQQKLLLAAAIFESYTAKERLLFAAGSDNN